MQKMKLWKIHLAYLANQRPRLMGLNAQCERACGHSWHTPYSYVERICQSSLSSLRREGSDCKNLCQHEGRSLPLYKTHITVARRLKSRCILPSNQLEEVRSASCQQVERGALLQKVSGKYKPDKQAELPIHTHGRTAEARFCHVRVCFVNETRCSKRRKASKTALLHC